MGHCGSLSSGCGTKGRSGSSNAGCTEEPAAPAERAARPEPGALRMITIFGA